MAEIEPFLAEAVALTSPSASVIVSLLMSLVASELDFRAGPRSDVGETRITDELLRSLMRRAIGGESAAVSELVQRVGPRLVRTVRQVLGAGHPDIDDVAQDAILGFLRALVDFRGQCSVVHFAHRITLLTALAARRRNGNRERRLTSTEDDAVDFADYESSPHVNLLASRRRQLVRELLDDLPEAIAESMALHFILGLTVDEIAATAKVPENTVWSRLRLGKAAMRKRLRRDPRLAELLRVFE